MRKLLSILLLACSLSSFGRKLYPGKNGGDNGFFTSNYPAVPGDTIVLNAGDNNRSYFAMNYLRGTKANPIVIINEGGQVILTAGFDFKNAHFVKLTGTGAAGVEYGFKVIGGTGVAIGFSERSEGIEIENVETYNNIYALWFKQDPSSVDSLNYPAFVMDGLKVHHTKHGKIGQDGFYIGNTTSINGISIGGITRYPFRVANIDIYDNILDSANRTAIQSGETYHGWIRDNTITRCGYEYVQDQGNGISIGGQSFDIHVVRNKIKYTFLYGIMNFGKGKNYIEGNEIDSCGFLPVDTTKTNIDSLAKKRDTLLHASNATWNTSFYHFRYSGNILMNNYSQPCLITMQPSNDLLQDPILDSSTVVIRNNKLGASIVVDGSWNVVGGNTNKISVIDYTRNPIGRNNFIVNNTLMDGKTAAAAPSVPVNFKYRTDALHITRTPVIQFTGGIRFRVR